MQYLRIAREYMSPLLKESKFKESGVLTPEEFVAAGDFLVYKCPTWQWASGIPEKKRDYLPADKQYLITKNVPCLKRVTELDYDEKADIEEEGNENNGEGWTLTHTNLTEKKLDDIEEIENEIKSVVLDSSEKAEDMPDFDDIPEIDDFVIDEIDDDIAALDNDKILRTRTYDLSITYDKYYQTPRVWLYGYDEYRNPLTSVQIFEDISQDHAKKTVTIESHPNENLSLASIHPCKHANVMKKILNDLEESGRSENLRVEQYLLIFLKFVAAVLPTMEYDYTTSADF
ncbi:E2-like enzyme [Clydaea vesicula]|uniref:Autophagy-related protein 3 n=1 Tax=Clydaea vesicula TaxID=447962 RepID=A0AAD5U8C3_9FUNG|nr:E2-like enzyme [Clydaea vesicula]KAJ3383066.1 E2-like enzyme [Lobulomyces angularis]